MMHPLPIAIPAMTSYILDKWRPALTSTSTSTPSSTPSSSSPVSPNLPQPPPISPHTVYCVLRTFSDNRYIDDHNSRTIEWVYTNLKDANNCVIRNGNGAKAECGEQLFAYYHHTDLNGYHSCLVTKSDAYESRVEYSIVRKELQPAGAEAECGWDGGFSVRN